MLQHGAIVTKLGDVKVWQRFYLSTLNVDQSLLVTRLGKTKIENNNVRLAGIYWILNTNLREFAEW